MEGEVKRGRGRPRKNPVPAVTVPVPPKAPAAPVIDMAPEAVKSDVPLKQRLDAINVTATSEIHVLRDPWKDKDPLKIKAHPEGFRLRWCSEKYRAHKGWEGWTPVRWDEEIGRDLKKYLADAPPRFEGMMNFDNFVRMGADAMLCKLPVEYWLARKEYLRRKNEQFTRGIRDQGGQTLAPGVRLNEGGLEEDTSDPSPLPIRGYGYTR